MSKALCKKFDSLILVEIVSTRGPICFFKHVGYVFCKTIRALAGLNFIKARFVEHFYTISWT